MAAVGLRIVEPENDAAFTGEPIVTFRGELAELPPELAEVPLFYRWYSSLFPGADTGRYSMNEDALTDAEEPWSDPDHLHVGSHVITFAASDRAGETDADLQAVQHAGVTGGLEGDARCVIHVFKAEILAPLSDVPLAGLTVEAEGPAVWAIPADGNGSYTLNDDYHAYNRLRYRWRFEPNGAPAGRPVREFTPDPGDFGFVPEADLARLTYQPALPTTATGSYRIVLFVEDALDQGLAQERHEVTVNLTG